MGLLRNGIRTLTKRTEAEILSDLRKVYAELSPENLSCDGELSPAQVRAKAKRLTARFEELLKELGRELTETDGID